MEEKKKNGEMTMEELAAMINSSFQSMTDNMNERFEKVNEDMGLLREEVELLKEDMGLLRKDLRLTEQKLSRKIDGIADAIHERLGAQEKEIQQVKERVGLK